MTTKDDPKDIEIKVLQSVMVLLVAVNISCSQLLAATGWS